MEAKFAEHAAILPAVRPEEVQKYGAYFALLREWNEKINLVSRKSIETSFAYHFADSIHLSAFAKGAIGPRVLRDLGTGAGFPGIVFAIRYPDAAVVLYEKLAKRRLFLSDVIEKLALKNTRLEGALPEEVFKDFFTARAVLPPAELFPLMKARLQMGGRLLLSLGSQAVLGPVPRGFKVLEHHRYMLPEDAGERQAVIVERVPRETK